MRITKELGRNIEEDEETRKGGRRRTIEGSEEGTPRRRRNSTPFHARSLLYRPGEGDGIYMNGDWRAGLTIVTVLVKVKQSVNRIAMERTVLLLVCLAAFVSAQKEDFKCPDDYGFYPHHISCDRYWKCDNGAAELKTCGNGLAFDDTDPKYLKENCDYLHNVDCGDRSQLEPAVGTPHCPRLYGIFPDESKCSTFWNCWNGEASKYDCSPGLAYDREARVCMWADQVPECKNEEVAGGFNCPAPGELPAAGTFSRHAHPDDCRKYFICLDNTPREYGCPIGTVFKIGDAEGTGSCEDPEDVQGCEDYYGDLDLKSIRKSELALGNGGSSRPAANSNTKSQSKPRPAPAPRPSQDQ